MNMPHYHEDCSTLHVNTLPNRAYYIPHHSPSSALSGDRSRSERLVMLSGQWRFGYYDSMLDLPEDIFSSEAAPDMIPVPSVWQCQGYDTHQYTNVRFPIPFDPPYVPAENPCGLYRRSFTWQSDGNERAELCFEGVDSCFYVWINHTFAGYSQVSHSTSIFDVSDLLRQGENSITVLVLKWCDGTYFEDQDKFRMSGIFRDVYLLRRSAAHLESYFVHTALTDSFTRADITVDMLRQGDAPVSWQLLDAQGKELLSGEESGSCIRCHLTDVHLWNSEAPYLYTLLLHCGDEWIAEPVGLRDIRIEQGVVKLNGQAVKFKGVNRHDSDPVLGSAVGMEQMMRDLTVMKQHNINAIRTSHYPNAPEFLRLCDRFGFYVVDESDVECHGVIFVGKESPLASYNAMAEDPVYEQAFVDRVQRCVIRDQNRPCVLIWSMGNEAGYGCNFAAALKWTKAYDPSRLTHYERASFPSEGQEINKTDLDLYSRMYPSIAEIDRYFDEKKLDKPYILCEYCHAMGNGPGDLEDYFDCFHRHEGHCGGFIWEWCDHAIDMGRSIDGRKKYFYGGDFGEDLHDGNFCMDGLVYPDRRPHTGLIEYKNVLRPARIVSADVHKGLITLWNTLDFTCLKDAVRIEWSIRHNGSEIYRASIPAEALDIAPHEKKQLQLPLPEGLSGEYALHLYEYQLHDQPLTPAGHLVGEDEAGRQTYSVPALPENKASIRIEENSRCITLTGERFRYVYNKTTACFDEMVFDQRTLLEKPMTFNIWRAPTDNDMYARRRWEEKRYHLTSARGYSTTLTQLDDGWQLTTPFSLSTAYLPPVVRGTAVWTIKGNGVITLSADALRREQDPILPRFGLRLFLPKAMNQVSYFGFGPYESYIDKHRSSFRHLYRSTCADLHEDYLKPQENGSHYDCSFLEVSDASCALRVTGESFSFSASPYTQEELTQKQHSFELEKCGHTVLCVDAYQSGIGSNSCGPELMEKYRIPQQMHMHCTFSVIHQE